MYRTVFDWWENFEGFVSFPNNQSREEVMHIVWHLDCMFKVIHCIFRSTKPVIVFLTEGNFKYLQPVFYDLSPRF